MAITIGATGKGSSASALPSTEIVCTVTGTPAAGNTLVISVTLQDPTVTVSSFGDDSSGGSMAFTQVSDVSVTGLRHQQWSTTVNASHSGFSFIKVNLTGSTLAGATWTEWLGAVAVGGCATATGTNADPTVTVTTQDANNVVVAGFASVGSTVVTAKTGTLDRSTHSGGANDVGSATAHNTAVSPSAVTVAITLAATTWIASGCELRTAVSAGGSTSYLPVMGIGS